MINQSSHKGTHLITVDKLINQGDAYVDGDVIKFRIPREATDIPEIHEINWRESGSSGNSMKTRLSYNEKRSF